jgi:hypothetical protein
MNGRGDPNTKWWTDLVRLHNPVIAQSGGLVVTRLQLNGLFADNDWVAKTAQLPVSTEASRAAFIRELPGKFAAMPQDEKVRLARADVRWFDLHEGVRFNNEMAQFSRNMGAISGLDFQTKSNANNLNFADRKFWGKAP